MKSGFSPIIIRCLTSALLVMIVISATAHAAEISPLEGLELARNGFAGMSDFTAEITQEKADNPVKENRDIKRPGPLPAPRHVLYGGLFAVRKPSFIKGQHPYHVFSPLKE
jgi:hypothetical protein